MSDRFLLGPRDNGTIEELGGKAFNLTRLCTAGVNVPFWCAVTTVAHGDTWKLLIEQWLERHRAVRYFAVRSSAIREDGPAASYAGQFTTMLNVPRDRVIRAVDQCKAGLNQGSADEYRASRKLQPRDDRLAVIVQVMINARASGVAFTADPRSGAPGLIVEAAYGLGEGVAADRTASDTYTRELGADAWTIEVAQKTHHVAPKRDFRGGTILKPLPASDQRGRVLIDSQLEHLANVLHEIEDTMGEPQDVEWAFDEEGTLYVLQARPITTLPRGPLAIWDDSNVGESYPGITLPLTASYVRLAYETVFTRALEEVGLKGSEISKLKPELSHLVGVIDGRLYFNLVRYYSMFAAVPGLRWTVGKWERALGVSRPGGAALIKAKRMTLGSVVAATRTWCRLTWQFLGLTRHNPRFRREVTAQITQYRSTDIEGKSLEELLSLLLAMNRDILPLWTAHVFNDLILFICEDLLRRIDPDCAAETRLSVDPATLESLDPMRSIERVLAEARRVPRIWDSLKSNAPPQVLWKQVQTYPEASRIRALLSNHLRRYGDRSATELKLESDTPATTPWLVITHMRQARAGANDKFRERPATRSTRTHGLLRGVAVRWLARLVRRGIATREFMSLSRARAYGILRRLVGEIGNVLEDLGAIHDRNDVFYLTIDDVECYARGGLAGVRLATLVGGRRAEYRKYQTYEPPHRIVCRGSPYLTERIRSPSTNGGGRTTNVLEGTPSCGGRRRGVARVVTEPPAEGLGPNQVLVAPVTDPGWIYALRGAAALVIERGSLLSHAAIIGRELGVPTVIGVSHATSLIKSGDEVEVDGYAGLVRVLNRADGEVV